MIIALLDKILDSLTTNTDCNKQNGGVKQIKQIDNRSTIVSKPSKPGKTPRSVKWFLFTY